MGFFGGLWGGGRRKFGGLGRGIGASMGRDGHSTRGARRFSRAMGFGVEGLPNGRILFLNPDRRPTVGYPGYVGWRWWVAIPSL